MTAIGQMTAISAMPGTENEQAVTRMRLPGVFYILALSWTTVQGAPQQRRVQPGALPPDGQSRAAARHPVV